MAQVHESIVQIMREIGAIGKDGQNVSQKYSYRRAEDVYNRGQPLFAKHGIFTAPEVLDQTREVGQTKGGSVLHISVLRICYTFFASDGSSVKATVVGEGMDAGDKASNKAQTAAHKYAICQILSIPYEVVDPDQYSPWRITTIQALNELKRKWVAAQGDKLRDATRDEKANAFHTWALSLIPEFDDGNLEHLAKLGDSLSETTGDTPASAPANSDGSISPEAQAELFSGAGGGHQ
jgi:hypothetical protein